MVDQEDYESNKPDAKVSGYTDVRYKNGEAKRVEFTVEYFIDDWYEMEFYFQIVGETAELMWLTPPGDHYNPQQSSEAREEAIRHVTSLPCVEYADMGN